MKYIPIIVMVIVQQGGTIFFMECVRRDLFLACGVSALAGAAAYLLTCWMQRRMASRRADS